MAFPLAAFFLTYLLSVSSADQISVNVSTVQKLVDYRYTTELGELLPGMRYNNSINVTWAVRDSALRGLEGQVVIIKVTATAANGSDISFPTSLGLSQSSAVAYLQCIVENSTCSNSSNLSAEIPLTITLKEGQASEEIISLKSEIAAGSVQSMDTAEIRKTASGLFDYFKNVFSQGNNSTSGQNDSVAPAHNASANNSSNNFLDSLKPEGDSKNPLEFLRSNPLISIAALGIVIIITGAYLVNAKD
ncbi:MAG: hypothetical protein WCT52_05285 [Candidatus Micrarchaeia archaeon]